MCPNGRRLESRRLEACKRCGDRRLDTERRMEACKMCPNGRRLEDSMRLEACKRCGSRALTTDRRLEACKMCPSGRRIEETWRAQACKKCSTPTVHEEDARMDACKVCETQDHYHGEVKEINKIAALSDSLDRRLESSKRDYGGVMLDEKMLLQHVENMSVLFERREEACEACDNDWVESSRRMAACKLCAGKGKSDNYGINIAQSMEHDARRLEACNMCKNSKEDNARRLAACKMCPGGRRLLSDNLALNKHEDVLPEVSRNLKACKSKCAKENKDFRRLAACKSKCGDGRRRAVEVVDGMLEILQRDADIETSRDATNVRDIRDLQKEDVGLQRSMEDIELRRSLKDRKEAKKVYDVW